jgi:hypothetical protein
MSVSIIPSDRLNREDIPDIGASWTLLSRFALTFDVREFNPYEIFNTEEALLDNNLSIAKIRAILYVEQRRQNNIYGPKDPEAIARMQYAVSLLRDILAS